MNPYKAETRLLKKGEILRALNISRMTFERKLEEGAFPLPYVWLTETSRGRRWHPADIERCFGILIKA